jgi:hypothetical protein
MVDQDRRPPRRVARRRPPPPGPHQERRPARPPISAGPLRRLCPIRPARIFWLRRADIMCAWHAYYAYAPAHIYCADALDHRAARARPPSVKKCVATTFKNYRAAKIESEILSPPPRGIPAFNAFYGDANRELPMELESYATASASRFMQSMCVQDSRASAPASAAQPSRLRQPLPRHASRRARTRFRCDLESAGLVQAHPYRASEARPLLRTPNRCRTNGQHNEIKPYWSLSPRKLWDCLSFASSPLDTNREPYRR